jgi:CDP-glycerol glycerophosphotransferase (TagB/SpsB family)
MPNVVTWTSAVIIALLTFIFLPITKIISRNKKIWIFGALDGKGFGGNPKQLFIYIKNNHKEIRAIWLSKNKNVLYDLKENGYECYYTYSYKGFYYSLIAGYIFCSNLFLFDINLIAGAGAIKINLFHGIPIKRIVQDVKPGYSKNINPNIILTRIYLFLLRTYNYFEGKLTDYIIACSEEHQIKMASAFRKSTKTVFITGYPRNDAIFSPISEWQKDNLFWEHIHNTTKFQYLFTFFPTYRDSRRSNMDLFTQYGFDPENVHQTLEKLNAVLLIKAHPAGELTRLQKLDSPRIIFVSSSQLPDIYPLLNKTSILLTDLSSVYLDYLLLNRPIIFTPFDLEEYLNNDRQLYYDYDEVTPGPKAKNWPEALEFIKLALKNDEWKAQREKIRDRFHKYMDWNSSERVYETINNIKNKKLKN